MSKFSQVISGTFLSAAMSTFWAIAAFAETPNIDGTWNVSLGGEMSAKLQLVQDGNNISGSITSPRGDLPLKGTVSSDRQVSFSVDFPMGGTGKFEGVVDGNAIAGTANLPRFGKKNWSANR